MLVPDLFDSRSGEGEAKIDESPPDLTKVNWRDALISLRACASHLKQVRNITIAACGSRPTAMQHSLTSTAVVVPLAGGLEP